MIYPRPYFRLSALLVAFILFFEPLLFNLNYAYAAETTADIQSTSTLSEESSLPDNPLSLISPEIGTSDTILNSQFIAPPLRPKDAQPYSGIAYDKDTNPLAPKGPSTLDQTTASTGTVELIKKRTSSTKTFKNPDGTFSLKSFAGPVHYKDRDKKWQEIDNTLVPSNVAGFDSENKANAFKARFSSVSANPLSPTMVEIESKGRKIGIGGNDLSRIDILLDPSGIDTFVGEKSVAVAKKTYEASFPAIYDGVTYNYKLSRSALKEDITLDKFSGKNIFLFKLDTTGLTFEKNANGSISFNDADSGKPVFIMPKPYMFDANYDPVSLEPAHSDNVTIDTVIKPSGTYLKVEADKSWLADSSRVYPVTIDPTVVNVYPEGDAYVTSAYPTSNYDVSWDSSFGGWYQMKSGYYNSTTGWNYSLIKFDFSPLKEPGTSIDIQSANLYVYAYYAYSTTPTWVNQIVSGWDPTTVTWNSTPASLNINAPSVGNAQWLNSGVTSTVQNWANQSTADNLGFLLHENGNTTTYWKKFASSENNNNAVPFTYVTYVLWAAGYQSSLTPKRIPAGKTVSVPITLTNNGSDTWLAGDPNPYHLGYKWYDQSGTQVTTNDIRTSLPSNVPPGGEVSVDAQVSAPSTPGTYTLKWDMVQEGVTWFEWKGVPTSNYTVIADNIDLSLSGTENFWSYEDLPVGKGGAKVNVANGNVSVEDGDVSIPGRGVPMGVTRYHNSQSGKLSTQPGFITKWLINGPYANTNQATRLSSDYLGGESSVQPILGTKSAGNFWRPYVSSGSFNNLNNAFSAQTNVAGYAHTYVYSPTTQSNIQLRLGSDDGIKAWLNGSQIWNNDVYRGATIDSDIVSNLTLNQGWNRLLIKVSQGSYGWGFYARLTDTNGNNLTNLTYAAYPGLFGPNWQAAFEENIGQFEDDSFIYSDPDGTAQFYAKNYAGTYSAPPGVYGELRVNGSYNASDPSTSQYDRTNWKYRLKETSGERRYFDGSGRLIRIVDGKNTGLDDSGPDQEPDANRFVLSYNDAGELTQLTDSSGRTFSATSSNKKITNLSFLYGGTNRTLTYAYNSAGDLQSSTLSDGVKSTTTSYGYLSVDPFKITTVTNPRGKVSTINYSAGKPSSFVDARSKTTGFNFSANPTIVTDANSKQTSYAYNSPQLNLTQVIVDTAGVRLTTSNTYNSVNQLTQITDASGNTTMANDNKGNVTQVQDTLSAGNNAVTNIKYDLAGNAPASPTKITDPKNYTSTNIYEAAGNLKSSMDPVESGSYIEYDAYKNPAKEIALPKTGGNLVVNSNFESPLTTGWNYTDGTGNSTIITNDKYFGTGALKVDGTNPSGQSSRVSATMPVSPSTVYTRSAYVKGTGHIITTQYNQSFGYLGGDYDQTFNTGNSWRRIAFTFSSQASAAYTQIYLRSDAGNIAYFDGVQLETGSVVSAYSLIENGSFERFTGSNPNDWIKDNGSAVVDQSNSKDGTYSYDFNLPSASTAKAHQGVAVKPNTTYLVTGWISSDWSSISSFFDYYIVESPSGSTARIYPTMSFLDWTRVSGTYTTGPTATTLNVHLDLSNNGVARNIWADAVQVTENPPAAKYEYDANGKNYLTKQTDALNNSTYNEYDGVGNLTALRDARSGGDGDNNYRTQYLYNEGDLLTQVTDPLLFSTYYDYDAGGNLTTLRDARSGSATDNTFKTMYSYDDLGQLSSITDPLGSITSYAYDNVGNETTVTQPNGSVVGKSYDGADRLSQLLYNGSLTYSFAYDAASNLSSIGNGAGVSWQYAYDKANRLTNATEYLGLNQSFGYLHTYDKNGNRTKLEAGINIPTDNQVYNYTYNANNWLTSASDAFGTANLFYDDRGNKIGFELPGSAGKTYKNFDSNNRPTIISNYNGTALLGEYTYGYDQNGNITTETVGGQSTRYSYDKLNRLDTWFDPIAAKYTKYFYDPVGNITSVKDSTDGNNWTTLQSFAYNAASQLATETIGGNNYFRKYDANGNQSEDPSNKYFYDAENRLTGVVKKGDIDFEDDFSDGNYNGWTTSSGT